MDSNNSSYVQLAEMMPHHADEVCLAVQSCLILTNSWQAHFSARTLSDGGHRSTSGNPITHSPRLKAIGGTKTEGLYCIYALFPRAKKAKLASHGMAPEHHGMYPSSEGGTSGTVRTKHVQYMYLLYIQYLP